MYEIVEEKLKFLNRCSKELIRMSVKSVRDSYKDAEMLSDDEKRNLIRYNLLPNNNLINPIESLNVCRSLRGHKDYFKQLDVLFLSIIDYFDPILCLYRKGSVDNETLLISYKQMNLLIYTTAYKIFNNDYRLDLVEKSIKEGLEFMNGIIEPNAEMDDKFIDFFNLGSGWTTLMDVWIIYVNQLFNLGNYLRTISQIESLDMSDNLSALKQKFENIYIGDKNV
jgi:hypothetical protein